MGSHCIGTFKGRPSRESQEKTWAAHHHHHHHPSQHTSSARVFHDSLFSHPHLPADTLTPLASCPCSFGSALNIHHVHVSHKHESAQTRLRTSEKLSERHSAALLLVKKLRRRLVVAEPMGLLNDRHDACDGPLLCRVHILFHLCTDLLERPPSDASGHQDF